MSLLRLRDSRDFSPYSSSTEWADEDKMSSALLEAYVEGPTITGSARFTGLKKEDMEEGPAVEQSAADMEGPAVAGSAVKKREEGEEITGSKDGQVKVSTYCEWRGGVAWMTSSPLLPHAGPTRLPMQLQLASPSAREWVMLQRENVRPWTVFFSTQKFRVSRTEINIYSCVLL
ncbi:hypothetical protein E2C01_048249 [Portunus trituberculatus]|uniref:Uncharacterized protein n=1 Tax=Portunus trituberculatus TaxID=210409 RepID=A0A5B7GB20_PORTR|nr:hypothetical protein [Portunus trituberculatus]